MIDNPRVVGASEAARGGGAGSWQRTVRVPSL